MVDEGAGVINAGADPGKLKRLAPQPGQTAGAAPSHRGRGERGTARRLLSPSGSTRSSALAGADANSASITQLTPGALTSYGEAEKTEPMIKRRTARATVRLSNGKGSLATEGRDLRALSWAAEVGKAWGRAPTPALSTHPGSLFYLPCNSGQRSPVPQPTWGKGGTEGEPGGQGPQRGQAATERPPLGAAGGLLALGGGGPAACRGTPDPQPLFFASETSFLRL